MTKRSVTLTVWLALVAALIGVFVAAALWPTLPDPYPVHFDAAGTPDRFANKSSLEWFALPGINVGITAMMLGIARLIRWMAVTKPGLVNIPDKAAFEALPPAARAEAVAPWEWLMAIIALSTSALFVAIQVGTHRVATGVEQGLPTALMIACMVAWMPAVVVALIAGARTMKRLKQAHPVPAAGAAKR